MRAQNEWVNARKFWISDFDFGFWNLRLYEHQRHGIRLSTESFACCNRNAIFCACKISKSFADHQSKNLISKVEKFYTDLSMSIQKNICIRISSQNSIHFVIRCHRGKHLSTLIKYRRFQKKKLKKCWPAFYYTVYSYESHHYGGCNQSLTRHTSTITISRIGKPAIQNYKVSIESVKNFNYRLRN